jgi:hypothetical protein
MGYHKTEIPKGEFGQFSKIKEEFLEAQDALEQNNHIMLLVELSDLLGAIDAYVKQYNLSIEDLIIMKNATKGAFEDGTRTSRTILTPDRIIKEGVNPKKLEQIYSIEDIENLEKIIKKDKNKRSTPEILFLSKAREYAENSIYAKILTQLGFTYKYQCPFSGKPIWKYGEYSSDPFDNKSTLEFDPLTHNLKYIAGEFSHFNTQIRSEQELFLIVIDRKNQDKSL